MQKPSTILVLLAGVGLGCLVSLLNVAPGTMRAGTSDRYDNYVMCTGAVSVNPRLQTDGVWLLDYRSGKLLGTVIDKSQGKIVGWAEVDLLSEFDMPAKSDVHFMMTTGYITQGQAALYVAETTTGKFGVYTMGPGTGGDTVTIRRHDMTSFRNVMPQSTKPAAATTLPVPGAVFPGFDPQSPASPVMPSGPVITQPVPVGPIPGLGNSPNPKVPGKSVITPTPVGPIPGLGQTPSPVTPMQPSPPSVNTPNPNGPPSATITPRTVPGTSGPPPLVIPK